MTHTYAKGQGQRSLGSKDRVETDGRTEDGGDCITSDANAVSDNLPVIKRCVLWMTNLAGCWCVFLLYFRVHVYTVNFGSAD